MPKAKTSEAQEWQRELAWELFVQEGFIANVRAVQGRRKNSRLSPRAQNAINRAVIAADAACAVIRDELSKGSPL